MPSKPYAVKDFRRAREWVATEGGEIFETRSSLEWFIRMHRSELVDSGELITCRGAKGTLLGPNFGRVALEIMQRKALRT